MENHRFFIKDCQGVKILKENHINVKILENMQDKCLLMNQHLLLEK